MKLRLIGSMLNLLYPPQASKNDEVLVDVLDRNTDVTNEVVTKASNIERALSSINDASEGLFK